jgi:hypothetical protein
MELAFKTSDALRTSESGSRAAKSAGTRKGRRRVTVAHYASECAGSAILTCGESPRPHHYLPTRF